MFGENKEEVNEVSKNDFKKIENDMFTEMAQSEYLHNGGSKNESFKMGPESFDLGGGSLQFQKVEIPKEVFQPSYSMVSDFINELRIKKVPQKHKERAKEILAPTENEVVYAGDLTGYLVGYLEKKYGSNILNSPWVGPLLVLGKFGYLQLEKERAIADGGEK